MGVGVWEFLSPALVKVRQNCESVLRFRKGKVTDYLQINLDSVPLHFLSALVLIGACYYGGRRIEGSGLPGWSRRNVLISDFAGSGFTKQEKLWCNQVLGMSTILQLMYIAPEIHNQIRDKTGNSVLSSAFEEQTPHFQVLFGDYVYGKLLKLLCDIDCTDRLPVLAEIICKINEGAIVRKEVLETGAGDHEITLEVLDKEFSRLFIEAGKIGVLLAGGSPAEAEHLGRFGKYLGIILGAAERGLDPLVTEFGRRGAVRSLTLLPEGWLRDAAQQVLSKTAAGTDPGRLAAVSGG